MAFDVYGPCPCGSGKKLKFCCHALAGEMEKVIKLRENNQPRVAAHQLEELAKSHPENPWIITSQASILLEDEQSQGSSEQAKRLLANLLESQPDHLLAIVMYASAALAADGFERAKPAIHRAFQRCVGALPELLAWLALNIAMRMHSSGRFMAAREHLALTMRLASEEDRRDIFVRLLEFDGETDIPYPLRSVHPLAGDASDQTLDKEAQQAYRLSNIGCWHPAAKRFSDLAERDQSADLWWNAGLCRAWDGDEASAAQALHQAAKLQGEYGRAVECETMAQLLDLNQTEDRLQVESVSYRVNSVARLLSRLDEQDRLARVELPPQQGRETSDMPAALFEVLDRPREVGRADQPLTPEDVPNVLAQLTIFDENQSEERSSQAFLNGYRGEEFENARRIFEEAAGDIAELDSHADENARPLRGAPRELAAVEWNWNFPSSVPTSRRRELRLQRWQEVVQRDWPDNPLSALDGKSPREAAGDPERKVPLAAAIFVLDAYCQRRDYSLDRAEVFKLLNLEPPGELAVSRETPLQSFTVMQLQRLPVGDLTDAQLNSALNRVLLIHHDSLLESVLKEVLKRPSCAEKVDLQRVYLTLSDLCRKQNRRDEALEWIEHGKEHARPQENAFELLLQWQLRELSLRLENPADARLQPLLQHIDEYYCRKIPELKAHVQRLVQAHNVSPPWEGRDNLATPQVATGSTTPGGIWTPATGDEKEAGEKKLWIPGQGGV